MPRPPSHVTKNQKKGFTLIELLVVVSIISFLSSVVIGQVQRARIRAQYYAVAESMKQMKKALELYRNDTGKYPYENAYFDALYLDVMGTSISGDQMSGPLTNPVSYQDSNGNTQPAPAPFLVSKYIRTVPKPVGWPNPQYPYARIYYITDETNMVPEAGTLCGTVPIKKYAILYYDTNIPTYAPDIPLGKVDGNSVWRCVTAD